MGYLCHINGCRTRSSYGFIKNKPLACKAHGQGMRGVTNICQIDGCTKQRIYGYTKAIVCANHRQDGMTNVISKLCQHLGCTKRPTYGFVKGKALTCAEHKYGDMWDVKNRLCDVSGCKKCATFGFVGGKPNRCAEHKEEEMENIHGKKCAESGCTKQRSYGWKGSGPYLCGKHKKIGMINLVSKKCEKLGCNTIANFGLPGHKKRHCCVHKESGEIYLFYVTCQATPECNEPPIYGPKYAERCEIHKLSSDFNLVERKCISCGLLNILNNESKCEHCSKFQFIRRSEYLKKQNRVKAFLDEESLLSDYEVSDKQFGVVETSQCSSYRPDFLYDCGSHCIVLEIDEGQHKGYSETCECVRMRNIAEMLLRPTIFVRYNPDGYLRCGKRPQMSHSNRMRVLKTWILKLKGETPPSQITIVHLFFDDKEEDGINNVITIDV
jgi:hypothetical protein